MKLDEASAGWKLGEASADWYHENLKTNGWKLGEASAGSAFYG